MRYITRYCMTWFMTPYNIVSLTVTISTKYSPFYEARSCAASRFSRLYGVGFHPEPIESILRSVYVIKNVVLFFHFYLSIFSCFVPMRSSNQISACISHLMCIVHISAISLSSVWSSWLMFGEKYGLWRFCMGLIKFEEYIFIPNKWNWKFMRCKKDQSTWKIYALYAKAAVDTCKENTFLVRRFSRRFCSQNFSDIIFFVLFLEFWAVQERKIGAKYRQVWLKTKTGERRYVILTLPNLFSLDLALVPKGCLPLTSVILKSAVRSSERKQSQFW